MNSDLPTSAHIHDWTPRTDMTRTRGSICRSCAAIFGVDDLAMLEDALVEAQTERNQLLRRRERSAMKCSTKESTQNVLRLCGVIGLVLFTLSMWAVAWSVFVSGDGAPIGEVGAAFFGAGLYFISTGSVRCDNKCEGGDK